MKRQKARTEYRRCKAYFKAQTGEAATGRNGPSGTGPTATATQTPRRKPHSRIAKQWAKAARWNTKRLVERSEAESEVAREAKHSINRKLNIATWNIRGLNEITKRQQVDKWMETKGIDILLLQETKVNTECTETRDYSHMFFATEVPRSLVDAVEKDRAAGKKIAKERWERATEKRGIGIAVAKKMMPFIQDIEAISGRIMTITIKGAPDYTIINTYSPHADYALNEKEKHYEALQKTIAEIPCKNWWMMAGDFNARLYDTTHLPKACFGPYTI